MASEDPFTSIQWDRGEEPPSHANPPPDPIAEADEQQEDDLKIIPQSSPLNSPSHEEEHHIDDEVHQNDDGDDDDDPSNSLLVSHPEVLLLTEGQKSETVSVNSPSSSHPNPAGESEAAADETTTDKNSNTLVEEPNLFHSHTIDCYVSSPIRDLDSASKPFISYQVTTTTNHPSVIKLVSVKPSEPNTSITVKVRRRYGDFRFLHDCLSNDYPQLLVPPIPSKLNFKYLTGDTFSSSFVHKRLNSLDRFVKYLTNHSILSQLAIFHLFISDSPDWATFTKNLKISKNGGNDEYGESSGFTSSVVNKVVNEDLLTETVMNFLTPSKHKRETNKDILEISDKLKKLYENLIKLDKIFSKLNKKNYDLSQDYEQFAQQINKLAAVQNNAIRGANGDTSFIDDPDTTIASTFSEHQQFTNNFKVFAQSLSFFSENWADLHKYIDESFLVSLKDCSKYIIALTHLIELQHNKKIDLQVLKDYLDKSKNELALLGGPTTNSHHPPPTPVINHHNSGIVNNTTQLIKDTLSTSATPHIGSSQTDNKVFKLQLKIDQLENEIKIQTQVVQDLTNKIIYEEYPNWDKFNKNELKRTMVGLCNQEINFYKGLVENWTDVELKLMKRLDELGP